MRVFAHLPSPVQSTDVHCHLYSTYHTIPVRPFSSSSSSAPNRHPPFFVSRPTLALHVATVQLRIFTSRSKAIKHAFKHTWQLPGERQGRGISTNQIDSFRKHRHGSRELRLTRKISFPDKLTLMLTGTLTDTQATDERQIGTCICRSRVFWLELRREEGKKKRKKYDGFGSEGFLGEKYEFLDWHD